MASMVDELRKRDMLKNTGVEMYSTGLLNAASRAPQAPKPAAAPAQPAGPSLVQRALPNTYAATKMAGEDIGAAYKQGGGGAAVGQAVRSSLTPTFGLIDDIGQKAAGALQVPAQALKTLATGDASPIGSEPANVSNPLIRAATATKNMTPQAMEQAVPVDPVRRPLVQTAQQTPAQTAQEVRPGIFRQGNSFSDTASGASEGARPAPVSTQNMAAADALAQRYTNPLVQAATQQPAQAVIPQDTGGYGLLDKNRIAQRNLQMDVQQMKPGSGTALKAFLQQQADAPGQQIERDKMARAAGESLVDRMTRSQEFNAKLGESAADRSLKSQELADNMKTSDVKRQAAGVELTAAQRLQALQGEYLGAETDAAREAAAKKLNALSGKGQAADEYMAVGGGETVVDPQSGLTVKNPDVLVNKRTGQPVSGQQAKPTQAAGSPVTIKSPEELAKLPSGAVFIGPDGKQHRKN